MPNRPRQHPQNAQIPIFTASTSPDIYSYRFLRLALWDLIINVSYVSWVLCELHAPRSHSFKYVLHLPFIWMFLRTRYMQHWGEITFSTAKKRRVALSLSYFILRAALTIKGMLFNLCTSWDCGHSFFDSFILPFHRPRTSSSLHPQCRQRHMGIHDVGAMFGQGRSVMRRYYCEVK